MHTDTATPDCTCDAEHLPPLSPGIDELFTARDAYNALELLVSASHTSEHPDLSSLLAVLNFWLKFNLSRAHAEYVAARHSP